VWGRSNSGVDECVSEHSLECDKYLSEMGCTISNLSTTCLWIDNSCSNLDKCEDIEDSKNPCNTYVSSKGKCFYNGINEINSTQRPCLDVADIVNCSQLLTFDLCMDTIGNTNIYPNLIGNSSNISICLWNIEEKICKRRNNNNGESNKNNTFIIIIVVVVLSILVTVIIIVIFILYRRKARLKLKESEGIIAKKKLIEMESTKSVVNSSSSIEDNKRRTGLIHLNICYLLSFIFRKI
jgi:hypothetical protein